MCFTLAGLSLLAVASDFGLLIGAVAVIGLGSSIFHPEASQVAQLASGGRKGLAQSIFQVGGNGGTAVGPLLAALIVAPYGQSAIGWFGIVAVVAALVLGKIGRWYTRRLAAVRSSDSGSEIRRSAAPAKMIRRAMFILVVLMFSKHFYLACMNSYFTFF